MRHTYVAVLALPLALAACAVSDDEEKRLGAETARQVEAQMPMVTDPVVTAYIEDLGQRLARAANRPGVQWRFRVVNSPVINAFAIPGGYVYINRGLIERAETLDELAGVVGHEVGHVQLRHSADQLTKQRRTGAGVAIVCTLTSICESGVAQVAINVGGSAYLAKHSREDEREADAAGIANVVRAGIHPGGIPAFFERIMAERRSRPGAVEAWFGTHPLEEDRIRTTRATIAGLDPAALSRLTRDDPAFRAIKQRLAEMPAPPELPRR